MDEVNIELSKIKKIQEKYQKQGKRTKKGKGKKKGLKIRAGTGTSTSTGSSSKKPEIVIQSTLDYIENRMSEISNNGEVDTSGMTSAEKSEIDTLMKLEKGLKNAEFKKVSWWRPAWNGILSVVSIFSFLRLMDVIEVDTSQGTVDVNAGQNSPCSLHVSQEDCPDGCTWVDPTPGDDDSPPRCESLIDDSLVGNVSCSYHTTETACDEGDLCEWTDNDVCQEKCEWYNSYLSPGDCEDDAGDRCELDSDDQCVSKD
jgi:hypothetical protein